MIRQLAPERPAAISQTPTDGSGTGWVAAAAAVRGAAVAASGLILTAGLALVLWAVTPASGDDVTGALQGGVAAFAAANLIPILIGGVTLTLPPLLMTLVLTGLFVATARRGRFLPQGRYQELVSVLVTAGVYGLIVAVTTRGLGPPGAVPAGWVWTSAVLALMATAVGMLRKGSAWHDWWVTTAVGWVRLGVRGGAIGFWVMIAGGGLALATGLIAHFGSGVAIAALAAPSWMDGLGMAMLGLAYVPNAVIAGVGYVSGVGFEIGPGTYSALATSTVDLPAVPLLAAAPDQSGHSWIGLAFLLVPAIAGYLIARMAVTSLSTRSERLLAVAVASLLTGALVGAAAAIARGGIGDGRWSTIGAAPLLVGLVVAAEVGVVALAVAAPAGGRAVPWRLASAEPEVTRHEDALPDDAAVDDAGVEHGSAEDAEVEDALSEDTAEGQDASAEETVRVEDASAEDAPEIGPAAVENAGVDVAVEDVAVEDTAPDNTAR